MLSIKLRTKLKVLRKNLRSLWYTVMKPLAYILTKFDNYRYKHKQDEISKWSDEYAIKLYSKVLIKSMINSGEDYEEFVVAAWCNDEYSYGLYTIRDFISNQHYNKNLQSWSYKIPFHDVYKIEKLTELLRLELLKYKGIECEYFIDENIRAYMVEDYRKTLRVELNNK